MSILKQGQTLWWVPSDERYIAASKLVTIEKLGRKWAYLSNRERIDIETLIADGRGYQSGGRCFRNKQEWLDRVETNRLLLELHHKIIQICDNTDILPVAVGAAANMLGVTLSTKETTSD